MGAFESTRNMQARRKPPVTSVKSRALAREDRASVDQQLGRTTDAEISSPIWQRNARNLLRRRYEVINARPGRLEHHQGLASRPIAVSGCQCLGAEPMGRKFSNGLHQWAFGSEESAAV